MSTKSQAKSTCLTKVYKVNIINIFRCKKQMFCGLCSLQNSMCAHEKLRPKGQINPDKKRSLIFNNCILTILLKMLYISGNKLKNYNYIYSGYAAASVNIPNLYLIRIKLSFFRYTLQHPQCIYSRNSFTKI